MTTKSKIFACLSYLCILVLIPTFTMKDDEFVQFHVKQGFGLFFYEIIYFTAFGIIGEVFIVAAIVSIFLSIDYFQITMIVIFVFSIVSFIISIMFLILSIIGIVNVYLGLTTPLPIVGKYLLNNPFFKFTYKKDSCK